MAPWPPKYSPPEKQAPNLPTNRSCLTPVRPTFPGSLPKVPGLSQGTLLENAAVQKYQRDMLKKFTTQDLVNLDVITDAKLKRSTLSTRPVHKLFTRGRWEVSPSLDHARPKLYPLPNRPGLSGYWVYDNLYVKSAIMPALHIATKVMESVHMLPWFASLMNYPAMTDIPVNRISLEDQRDDALLVGRLKSFSPGGAMDAQMLRKTKTQFEKLVDLLITKHRYQLGFSKYCIDPWTGQSDSGTAAITCRHQNSNDIFTFLSYDLIEPLLRDDLTDCERMGLEWAVANTLVHEVCHALYEAVLSMYRARHQEEAYLADQPVAELGYAMEHAVFGGIAETMRIPPDWSSIGYWLAIDHTCVDIAFRSIEPILIDPPLSQIQTFYPIKAEFFENMQQEEFWSACINVFGWSALHARNLQQGTTVKYMPGLPQNRRSAKVVDSVDRFFAPNSRIRDLNITLAEYANQNSGTMTGVQRRNIQIGRKIVAHSVYEGNFWLQTVEMREFLDAVADSMEYVAKGRSQAERRQALDEICAFLETAETKHIVAIRTLRKLDRTLQRQNRLDDLLSWNRGARIYAKGCFDLISDDGAYMEKGTIIQRREAFEYCRMLLFAPTDTTTVPGYGEHPIILALDQNIQLGQVDLCRANLIELARVANGSMYVEAVGLAFESELVSLEFASRGVAMDLPALNSIFNGTTRALAILEQLEGMCKMDIVEMDVLDIDNKTIESWIITLATRINRGNKILDICRETAAKLSAMPKVAPVGP
ncbi:uncharacterized protein RSE6_05653 [Rhynchosporium secalis]|uniref:Uncharacterized protein n=1 Tax=Rhynchosporium secalis TaxID=38038 RepID=A0A1E1M8C9_RHYSE|nr:uncharacterized protein RSE6_05653 [Rhynchosporium secalis]